MTHSTHQQFLTVLEGDWAAYVRRFRDLPAEKQSAFLARQGYTRFVDILAHLIAWWEVGSRAVESYLADPAYRNPEYNVDAFNAASVAKMKSLSEDEVIQCYERMRLFMLDFITRLPDAAFTNEKVVNQLNMELIGHLTEHNLPG
jgi:hypothetical protein